MLYHCENSPSDCSQVLISPVASLTVAASLGVNCQSSFRRGCPKKSFDVLTSDNRLLSLGDCSKLKSKKTIDGFVGLKPIAIRKLPMCFFERASSVGTMKYSNVAGARLNGWTWYPE